MKLLPCAAAARIMQRDATISNTWNRSTWWYSGAVCLLAALAIFVLPLFVPVPYRATISASYVAGFNNTAAVAATVSLSVAVFLIALRRKAPVQIVPVWKHPPLGKRFIAGTVALSSLVFGLAGWIVTRSHAPYLADAGYFIEVATARRETGLPLYSGLEFAYGPLLLLPEVWLSKALHCSMHVSYFLMLVVDQAIGLLMTAFVMNRLPMTRNWRRAAYGLIAFGCLSPILGVNYTLLRFASAIAAVVLCAQFQAWWKCAATACAAEALVLFISPEMGMALMVGLTCLFLTRFRRGWRWIMAVPLPLLILIADFASVDRPYLRMASQFSRGTLNIPVGPYPHLLIFLFAVVWLVPCGLAVLMHGQSGQRSMLLACYAVGLSTLPAALGRCDPLHVFFNGLPFLLLSSVVASGSARKAQGAWAACLVVFVGWQFYVNAHLLQDRTADVVRLAFAHPDVADFRNEPSDQPSTTEEALYQFDARAFNHLVGPAPVATPVQISPQVEAAIIASHHYHPGFYSFGVDCMNPAAEQRRIQDMNANEWALLPRAFDPPLLETAANLDGVQGFALPYPNRHPNPTDLGDAFQQNIDDNWRPVQNFGPYILFHKQ